MTTDVFDGRPVHYPSALEQAIERMARLIRELEAEREAAR